MPHRYFSPCSSGSLVVQIFWLFFRCEPLSIISINSLLDEDSRASIACSQRILPQMEYHLFSGEQREDITLIKKKNTDLFLFTKICQLLNYFHVTQATF